MNGPVVWPAAGSRFLDWTNGDRRPVTDGERHVALPCLSFLKELLSRFQEETMLQENLRVARPWGFELSEAGKVPVAVWQGEQDVGCTKVRTACCVL